MLALRGIVRSFGRRRAVDGVSLEVAAGEAVLLVGRNGAGKTTLLRIAAGFLDPDQGEVIVDGIAMARQRARAQARLGYLPEHAPAPGELTVRDHLYLRARQKRVAGARAAVDAAIDRAIALAGLGDTVRQPIATLSKGFRQRVGLADALLGDPPLVILDEPTSGMDPIQVVQLRDHLIAAARDRAVLVSSHAVSDLEALASRVAVLRGGALVALDAPDALCRRTGAARLDAAVVALLGEQETA
ncbi:MAG TPA: ABC transporter ATP-binding protein [Kofleriaceae bacterium]|jgi:ABC-2 type transport system ATP-binding protein|nr:ABC transporter ATP-binding protein [Kofleriaceae bacterium]